MLHRDGAYTFYRLQFLARDAMLREPEWKYANLDHFGYPPGFNASGECWQQIGQHGTYDEEQAHAGLAQLRDGHPNERFRLVRVSIVQHTDPVVEAV